MIDTFCFAEIWRRRHKLFPFSDTLLKRLTLATCWMEQFTCLKTGGAPNLGANDGTHILSFTNVDTRDFRPSLQLASNLFRGSSIIAPDFVNQQLKWLGVKPIEKFVPSPKSATFDVGGFHVLRKNDATVYFRYPRFRFRPSQADVLHLDFWVNGKNILRDAGSFSYNNTRLFRGNCPNNRSSYSDQYHTTVAPYCNFPD